MIGKDGVEEILEVALTEEEEARFHQSCSVIRSFLERAEKVR